MSVRKISRMLAALGAKPALVPVVAMVAALSSNGAHANLSQGRWIYHAAKDYDFSVSSQLRGSPMVPLQEVAAQFKLKLSYDARRFEVRLADPVSRREISFFTFDEQVRGKGFGNLFESELLARLSRRAEYDGVRLCVPMDFGDRALRPLLTGQTPSRPAAPEEGSVDVVIDAGHGGNDWGASLKVGRHLLHEKNLTLRLALELGEALRQRGVKVALTRTDDIYLTLPERTRFANASRAKLFLAIHLNADSTGRQMGFENYVLSLVKSDAGARAAVARENQTIPEDLSQGSERALSDLRAESQLEASLDWAKKLAVPLGKSLKPAPHPIRMGPFYVLYGAEMPAVLLELGYLTSARDRELLLNAARRSALFKEVADSLASQLKTGIKQP